jgi:hypothetical protein
MLNRNAFPTLTVALELHKLLHDFFTFFSLFLALKPKVVGQILHEAVLQILRTLHFVKKSIMNEIIPAIYVSFHGTLLRETQGGHFFLFLLF